VIDVGNRIFVFNYCLFLYDMSNWQRNVTQRSLYHILTIMNGFINRRSFCVNLNWQYSRNLRCHNSGWLMARWWTHVYAISDLHFRDVTTGLQRSSRAFNVIRRTAARAHRSGHLKGLKVWDYQERPAHRVSWEFPQSNQVQTDLIASNARNSRDLEAKTVLFRLRCRKFCTERNKRGKGDRWWASFQFFDPRRLQFFDRLSILSLLLHRHLMSISTCLPSLTSRF
jgi:hypothetical protein